MAAQKQPLKTAGKHTCKYSDLRIVTCAAEGKSWRLIEHGSLVWSVGMMFGVDLEDAVVIPTL